MDETLRCVAIHFASYSVKGGLSFKICMWIKSIKPKVCHNFNEIYWAELSYGTVCLSFFCNTKVGTFEPLSALRLFITNGNRARPIQGFIFCTLLVVLALAFNHHFIFLFHHNTPGKHQVRKTLVHKYHLITSKSCLQNLFFLINPSFSWKSLSAIFTLLSVLERIIQ